MQEGFIYFKTAQRAPLNQKPLDVPYVRLKKGLSLALRVSVSLYLCWSLLPLSLSHLVSSEEC